MRIGNGFAFSVAITADGLAHVGSVVAKYWQDRQFVVETLNPEIACGERVFLIDQVEERQGIGHLNAIDADLARGRPGGVTHRMPRDRVVQLVEDGPPEVAVALDLEVAAVRNGFGSLREATRVRDVNLLDHLACDPTLEIVVTEGTDVFRAARTWSVVQLPPSECRGAHECEDEGEALHIQSARKTSFFLLCQIEIAAPGGQRIEKSLKNSPNHSVPNIAVPSKRP